MHGAELWGDVGSRCRRIEAQLELVCETKDLFTFCTAREGVQCVGGRGSATESCAVVEGMAVQRVVEFFSPQIVVPPSDVPVNHHGNLQKIGRKLKVSTALPPPHWEGVLVH